MLILPPSPGLVRGHSLTAAQVATVVAKAAAMLVTIPSRRERIQSLRPKLPSIASIPRRNARTAITRGGPRFAASRTQAGADGCRMTASIVAQITATANEAAEQPAAQPA